VLNGVGLPRNIHSLDVYGTDFVLCADFPSSGGIVTRGTIVGNWLDGERRVRGPETTLITVAYLTPFSQMLPNITERAVLLDKMHLVTTDASVPNRVLVRVFRRPVPLLLDPTDHFENVLTFGMPAFSGEDIRNINLDRAPCSSPYPLYPLGHFYSNGQDALIAVLVSLTTSQYEIRVSAQALLSYLPSLASSVTRLVPWAEWGPPHAHIVERANISDQQASTYSGLRALALEPPALQADGSLVFEVHDYHPGRVGVARALAQRVPEIERNWTVRMGGAVLLGGGENITTRVPYISSLGTIPPELVDTDRPGQQLIFLMEDGIITLPPPQVRLFLLRLGGFASADADLVVLDAQESALGAYTLSM
jgi:hypothetical protein